MTTIEAVIEMRKQLGRKFEVDDVMVNWPLLSQAAYDYLETYTGSFEFLLEVQQQYELSSKLTAAQVKGVLNCLCAQQSREEVVEVVPNGTYTVVDGNQRTTIKIDTCHFKDVQPGTQMGLYMSGSDNERDFVSFCFIRGDKANLWSRYKDNLKLRKAVDILLRPDTYKACGEAYALQSGRCYKCGRKLTVPVSLHRGLGPVCAGE